MAPTAASGGSAWRVLERLLAAPKYEVLPLTATITRAGLLPRGAVVAVSVSPSRGHDATFRVAASLQQAGFTVVAHVAARMIRGACALRRLVAGLHAVGVERIFVVGGDAERSGDFADGLALLRALRDLQVSFAETGVPCYPQGHPSIPDERLFDDLAAKQPYADYMTTQLCFDAGALDCWLRRARSSGCGLPVDIGVAGVVNAARLLRIGARIGVRDAGRFLASRGKLFGRLLQPRGYRPDRLLDALAPTLAEPALGVRGLHVYTFNSIRATEAWRSRHLRKLAARR